MNLGQSACEITVSFIGDNDVGTCFGNQEVGAGNADIGRDKRFAQNLASFLYQGSSFRLTLGEAAVSVVDLEKIGDFILGFVNGGGDDVARRLLGELQNIFAKVRLSGFETSFIQGVIYPHFLAYHRLAANNFLCFGLAADVGGDATGLIGRTRPVNVPPGLNNFFLVSAQVEIQIR